MRHAGCIKFLIKMNKKYASTFTILHKVYTGPKGWSLVRSCTKTVFFLQLDLRFFNFISPKIVNEGFDQKIGRLMTAFVSEAEGGGLILRTDKSNTITNWSKM